jgi:uncharacterized phosphosugar-binding protein
MKRKNQPLSGKGKQPAPSKVTIHEAKAGARQTPSSGVGEFRRHVGHLLDTIHARTSAAIEEAADILVQAVEKDALIHIGGAGGHSQIPAMEMFYRAGGLANVSIIFGPGLGLFDGKPCLERVPGMGGATMAYHDVRPEDVVIIVNYYGMNAATIDLALAAKARGCRVIGITSTAFSRKTPKNFRARHPSRKNLGDVVDLVLDTHTSAEEQVVPVPGFPQKVGVASSLAGCYIAQLLTIRTVEKALQRGLKPPVWMCANLPGGDEENDGHLKKYIPRMRHLYPEGETYRGD